METLKIALASALLVMATSHSAQAADSAFFKPPIEFAGTGCNSGSVVTNRGNSAIMVISFGHYDAGKSGVSGLARSSCNFVVPVHVPPNMKLSGMLVTWNGFVKGKGQLTRTYRTPFNPHATPNRIMDLNSPDGKPWYVIDDLMHLSNGTGCRGGDFNIRISSSIKITDSYSYAAVGALNTSSRSHLIFHLSSSDCLI